VHTPPSGQAKLFIPKDFWPSQNEAYQAAIDTFVTDFGQFISLTSKTISLEKLWLDSEDNPNVPLSEYLGTVR
jgi:hypothetical protein